jgi:two-component system phosphate regulon sensor histidine kinase PhoR
VRPDTRIDLVPLLRQVIDGLEPLAKERQVAIETELPDTSAIIAGDREELLRLFENLVENGLKYGASGGRVVVSLMQGTSPEGASEWQARVRDFGPGMVKHILNRHRGRLVIESVAGEGATFTAAFPQPR